MMVHIGKEIEKVYKEKGLKMSKFAESMGMVPRNMYRIFEKPDMDTSLLRKFNKVLECNFFELFCPKAQNIVQENTEVYQKQEKPNFKYSITLEIESDDPEAEALKTIFGDRINKNNK